MRILVSVKDDLVKIKVAVGSAYRLVKGNTIEMSPQQYLSLAMPFGHQGGPEMDQAKVDALAKLSHFAANPMLSVKETADGKLQVGLHDGRHRAAAVLKRGGAKLHVDIVLAKRYAREHPETTNADLAELVVRHGLLPEV